MKKILEWIDQHGMFSLSLFLLLFIPLYPKLPLLDAIPGYLVRIRLEDIAVALTGGFWLVQLLRKKITTSWPMIVLVGSYAVAGLLSLLIAIGLQQTIPLQLLHIGKSVLHYGRYLEYFSLFFFLHSGIKTKRQLQIVLISIVVGLVAMTIYGFGQRHWQWPVYSTMNREYSKGEALTLTESARVNSTFGGHYDLAAYLVIILPVLFSLILLVPSKKAKIAGSVVAAGSLWLLLASAQKTSLFAFMAAMAVIWFGYLSTKIGWLKTTIVTVITGAAGIAVLILFLNTIGGKYADKINRVLAGEPSDLPQDFVGGQLDETWSENAKKYGLSMGIRLDTLWPQALYGFSLNPWTGKGYATLNKQGLNEFTEADSTDNNYLRTLGETGLLGTLILGCILWYVWKTIRHNPPKDPVVQALVLGYTAGLIGLLGNAVIIDVFAASKVAFSFWGLTGLVVAATHLGSEKKVAEQDQKTLAAWWNVFTNKWPLIVTVVVFVLLAHKRPFSEYSPVQGFSFDQTSAVYAHAARCLATTFTNCHSILTRIPVWTYPYVAYLAPWYRLLNLPSMFYFANLTAVVVGLICWQKVMVKVKLLPVIQLAVLLLLISPVVRNELVSIASPLNLIVPLVGLLCWWLSSQKMSSKALASLVKISQEKPGLAAGISIAGISFALLFMSQGNALSTVQKNFRDQYDVHHFRAIRRMNEFMVKANSGSQNPVMLNYLSPDYVALFSGGQYHIAPPPTSENAQYVKQQLQDGRKFYFMNAPAHIENTASLASTLFMANQFGLQLNTIDCEHRCNVYDISSEPLALPTKVTAANQQTFAPQIEYTLVIASNQMARFFNPSSYLPSVAQVYKDALQKSTANGFIFIGDSTTKIEENHGSFFRTQFIEPNDKPVLYSLGHHNTSVESYGPAQQRFVLGKTMIVVLDDSVTDHPTAQQHLLIDTLLQLYQHPEITDLVVMSNSLNWTQGLTAADKSIVTQYTSAHQLRWHVLSAQNGASESTTELFSFITNPVTYVGMNSHSEPINLLWHLHSSESGVEVLPVQIQPQGELNIDDYRKKNGV